MIAQRFGDYQNAWRRRNPRLLGKVPEVNAPILGDCYVLAKPAPCNDGFNDMLPKLPVRIFKEAHQNLPIFPVFYDDDTGN